MRLSTYLLRAVLFGLVLVAGASAQKAATAAAAKAAPAKAAPAACTTCGDAFKARGWNLAALPADSLATVVDETAVVTCFVPPADSLSTLQAKLTQLKVKRAAQKTIIADVVKYHISSSNARAITPATIPKNTPLATSAALDCSSALIVSPSGTTGLTVVDGAANAVVGTKIAGTCKTVAAYSVPDLLMPCETIKALATATTAAAEDPTADPTADPTDTTGSGIDVTDTTGATGEDPANPSVNPLATGSCLERVLGAGGAVSFAKYLKCTKLHDTLTQGTAKYTIIAPNDEAFTAAPMAASCEASMVPATLENLRYYMVPKAQSFLSLVKASRVATLFPKAKCNQNTLIFSNGPPGADQPTVTGGAFSANVLKENVLACKGKISVNFVDRALSACCKRRSDDIAALMKTNDPQYGRVIGAFVKEFQIQTAASGAGGTCFLPTPAAIAAFAKAAVKANYTLSADTLAQLVSYHLTTSTLQITQALAGTTYVEDTSMLSRNPAMSICSANDPSFLGRIQIKLGDVAQEASGATFPKGKYLVNTVTTADILAMRQNCDGVIYIVSSVLVPCPIEGVAGVVSSGDSSPAVDDPFGTGGLGGLGGVGGLGAPTGDPLGTGTLTPGTTTNTRSTNSTPTGGLTGDINSLLGLSGTTPSGSSAAGVRATLLPVLVALGALVAALH